MSTATLVIGPEHHGQKMSLEDFENAQGREGYVYELGRGVVVVTEVPHPRHGARVYELKKQLAVYDATHPGHIHRVFGGSDCRIPVKGIESERHPDVAVYLEPEPDDEPDVWARWIPAIVVEVVSPSSLKRDYEEKPEEYLQFGIREYWIIDADKEHMTALRRSRGAWDHCVIDVAKKYTTPLLPGFEFDLQAVFEAAGG